MYVEGRIPWSIEVATGSRANHQVNKEATHTANIIKMQNLNASAQQSQWGLPHQDYQVQNQRIPSMDNDSTKTLAH